MPPTLPSAGAHDAPSAQDLWLQSQGANLGNGPTGSLGLGGVGESQFSDYNQRGGRIDARYAGARPTPSRTATAYDNPNAAGTVSAPLSPSRLYAQLELGRGPSAPTWNYESQARGGAYGAPGAPPTGGSSFAGSAPGEGSGSRIRNAPGGRDLSLPPSQLHQSHTAADTSPLPTFAPFSPPTLSAPLAHAGGNDKNNATFISPSTLLSPAPQQSQLPPAGGAEGVEVLTQTFDKLGVGKDDAGRARTPTEKQ